MKTPEEILKKAVEEYDGEKPYIGVEYDGVTTPIYNGIQQAQTEAWNEAVKACAKVIICECSFDCIIKNEESILKLQK